MPFRNVCTHRPDGRVPVVRRGLSNQQRHRVNSVRIMQRWEVLQRVHVELYGLPGGDLQREHSGQLHRLHNRQIRIGVGCERMHQLRYRHRAKCHGGDRLYFVREWPVPNGDRSATVRRMLEW